MTTKDDDDSEKAKEENVKQYSRLMASLAQCEWIESKTKLVQDMNKVEAKNYDQLYDDIKVSIDTYGAVSKLRNFAFTHAENTVLAQSVHCCLTI